MEQYSNLNKLNKSNVRERRLHQQISADPRDGERMPLGLNGSMNVYSSQQQISKEDGLSSAKMFSQIELPPPSPSGHEEFEEAPIDITQNTYMQNF